MTDQNQALPRGQTDYGAMPRFGLPRYARRVPAADRDMQVMLIGPAGDRVVLSLADLSPAQLVEQRSDFHCVTTWSARNILWRGLGFAALFHRHKDTLNLSQAVQFVVIRAHDGYRTFFHLEDLLQPDVLLATEREGDGLDDLHGLPFRLVSPSQYGYKNVKFVKEIEFRASLDGYRVPGWTFMDHPRARVALEERARHLPGWLIRYPYRSLIKGTVRRFAQAWDAHKTAPSD